jgi:predicted nucleotidyltransferase
MSPDRRPSPLLDFAPRAGACPPGVIDRIVEVLHPEQIWLFGSRARGTAGPESDWDLMVVVSDSAAMAPDDESWHALRDVRRQRIEIVPIHRAEFEADRREFGTLAQVASTTGRLVYGR